MNTVIVLDFDSGEVHIYYYPETEDVEKFIQEKGHRLSNSLFMTVDRLILHIHEPEV